MSSVKYVCLSRCYTPRRPSGTEFDSVELFTVASEEGWRRRREDGKVWPMINNNKWYKLYDDNNEGALKSAGNTVVSLLARIRSGFANFAVSLLANWKLTPIHAISGTFCDCILFGKGVHLIRPIAYRATRCCSTVDRIWHTFMYKFGPSAGEMSLKIAKFNFPSSCQLKW